MNRLEVSGKGGGGRGLSENWTNEKPTARSNDVCATKVDNWVLISRSNDLRKRLSSLALFDSLDVVSVAFWD